MTARRRDSRLTVYGPEHRAARAAYVARYRPGQACVIGGEQLWCHPRWLDLAHDHVRGGYLGLACRYHNRSEAAVRNNRLRGLLRRQRAAVTAAPRWPSRDW